MSNLRGDCRADFVFESRGFDFTFSHFSDDMSDNFSSGTSVEENVKDKKTETCKYVPFSQRGHINNFFFFYQ